MDSEFINLKLLQQHAEQTADARKHLLCQRFDPHLQQPLFGESILPKFSGRAEGCRIWDSLGRPFIDWSGHAESNLLGYRHPAIVEAIKNWALDTPVHELDPPASCDGPFTDPREVSIVRKIASAFDQGHGNELLVGLTRGRNEALYSAAELARTLTGRPLIAVVEQQSKQTLHSEDQRFRFLQSHFQNSHIKQFVQGDLPGIRWLLKTNLDQIAAFLIAPPAFETLSNEFTSAFQELLKRHGTLLIMDDSQTAFRAQWPGEQRANSLSPDITVFGENLAGPFAFSAIVGKQELLSRAWRSTIRTLDRPAGLTLDVVEATLDVATECNLPSQLKHIGSQLLEEFNDFADAESIPIQLVGNPTRMAVQFKPHRFLTPEQMRSAFCMLALEHGLVTHGEFWPNAAHDGDALFETLRGMEATAKSFVAWMESVAKPEAAIDEPFSKYEVRGRIDALNMVRKTLVISGWILVDGQSVDFSAVNDRGERIEADRVTREDLAAAMPDHSQATEAGFRLSLDVDSVKKVSRFLIEAKRDGKLLYRTLLVHDPSKQTSAPYPFTGSYLPT